MTPNPLPSPDALALPAPSPTHYRLGTAVTPDAPAGAERPFALPPEWLQTHMAVLGGTGRGKSKFLEQLCRELLRVGRGFLYVDPHSDTARDLLAFVAECGGRVEPFTRLNVHFLEPGPDAMFAFDPFHYPDEIGPKRSPEHFRYVSWLKAQVDRVMRVIIRQQGEADFEGKPRLKRFLRAACYACGVAYDRKGTHLGLHELLVVLDPKHERHQELYARVEPHLPDAIRTDLRKVRSEKRARDQEQWVESTVNRVTDLLNPITHAMFASKNPSIDFRKWVADGAVVLCSFKETDFLSADQADALGGIFIAQTIAAARALQADGREPFHLIVDEAERFLGDDLRRGFAELRKMKLSLCLAVQDLSALRKGELDLVPKVLSQCGVKVTFQQQLPEDASYLAEAFGWRNLAFEEFVQVVDRPDGYDWVPTQSVSAGASEQDGESEGGSATDSRTESTAEATTASRQATWADTQTRTASHATNEGVTAARAVTRPVDPDRATAGNRTESEARQAGRSASATEGTSSTTGGSEGLSTTDSRTSATGRADTANWGKTRATGRNVNVTCQHTPLARQREERHPTGRLRMAVADQLAFVRQVLERLPPRHCLVSCTALPRSFLMTVADVDDPFAGAPAWKAVAIDGMRRRLMARRPYLFVPELSAEWAGSAAELPEDAAAVRGPVATAVAPVTSADAAPTRGNPYHM